MKTDLTENESIAWLEVGCGNGINCISLAQAALSSSFDGVDFIEEMVASGKKNALTANVESRVSFHVGDVLSLDKHRKLKPAYDVVFTNRCLINLNSFTLQAQALQQLTSKIKKGGFLFLIENVQQTYDRQNELRTSVGLAKRTPDSYNLFLDEPKFLEFATHLVELVEVIDFGSLHDVMLYVLVPMISDGKVDYDHPIVQAATNLLLSNPSTLLNSFGSFGQNRLYAFKKQS